MYRFEDVAEITRDDVLSVLKPIWKEKTETAKRVRGRMEIVFDYAARRGWRKTKKTAWNADYENPSAFIRRFHRLFGMTPGQFRSEQTA